MACALPAEQGVPLSRWSSAELALEAVKRGIVATIAAGMDMQAAGCCSCCTDPPRRSAEAACHLLGGALFDVLAMGQLRH